MLLTFEEIGVEYLYIRSASDSDCVLQQGAVSEKCESVGILISDKIASTMAHFSSSKESDIVNNEEGCKIFWKFYRDTGGEYWINKPDLKQPCTEYSRVKFNSNMYDKISIPCFSKLDLSSNNVSGTLPDYMWKHMCGTMNLSNNSLTAVEILEPQNITHHGFSSHSGYNIMDLSFNKLTRFPDIPKRYTSFVNAIYVNHNMLSGPVPNLANFFNLEVVDMSYNKLSGPVPEWMYNPRGTFRERIVSFAYNSEINSLPVIKQRWYDNDIICDISGTSIKPVCNAPIGSIHDLCNNIKQGYHCLDDNISYVASILVICIVLYNLLAIFNKKIRLGASKINSMALVLSSIYLLVETYMLELSTMITVIGWLKLEARLFVNIIALLWYTNISKHNITDSSEYNGLLTIPSVLNLKIKSPKVNMIELVLSTFDLIMTILLWTNGMNRITVLFSGLLSVFMLILTVVSIQSKRFLSKN